MSNPAQAVRIGTMIKATEGQAPQNIAAIADLGFESFEPFFWQTTNGQDLAELGKRSLDAIGKRGCRQREQAGEGEGVQARVLRRLLHRSGSDAGQCAAV